MDSLRGKEHTSLYVVGGVIVTIGAAAHIPYVVIETVEDAAHRIDNFFERL